MSPRYIGSMARNELELRRQYLAEQVEEFYNKFHDPENGRFTSGDGGGNNNPPPLPPIGGGDWGDGWDDGLDHIPEAEDIRSSIKSLNEKHGLNVRPLLNSALESGDAARVFNPAEFPDADHTVINIGTDFSNLARQMIESDDFVGESIGDLIQHEYNHVLDFDAHRTEQSQMDFHTSVLSKLKERALRDGTSTGEAIRNYASQYALDSASLGDFGEAVAELGLRAVKGEGYTNDLAEEIWAVLKGAQNG